MLTISTLNYNNVDDTVQCLEDVTRACSGLQYRILVRDNSPVSQVPELKAAARECGAPIMFFESPENPGFGRGHNLNFRAVQHAPSDVFLILNNDIRLPDPRCIKALLAAAGPARIVSSVIRSGAGGQTWFAGGSVHPWTGDLTIEKSVPVGASRNTKYISGCCFMIAAELFERLGGFDERFFMYAEDLDLCLRANAEGAELLVINSDIVHGVGSGQKGSYSDLYLYENTKNRLICLREHRLGLMPLSLAYFFFKYGVIRAMQLMLRSQRPFRQIRAAWRGLLHGSRTSVRSRPSPARNATIGGK